MINNGMEFPEVNHVTWLSISQYDDENEKRIKEA